MALTYRILARLLCYPDAEMQAAMPELRAVLDEEALLSEERRAALDPLLDMLAGDDLYDLQERYVGLFDRSRALSLYLFEHVHGESRDRGQAMVDLLELYRSHGLDADAAELPDFLPLFLEFLSTLPDDEARDLLGQPLPIVAAMAERLGRRDPAHAAVLDALVHIAGEAPPREAVEALARELADPDDLAALDREWADDPVVFGPDAPDAAGSCPRTADILRRMAEADTPSPAADTR
jgi:nitrate reductase molybdenum cofactor assembly chaperone NarJ/NarW